MKKSTTDQGAPDQAVAVPQTPSPPVGGDRLSRVLDWLSIHRGSDFEARRHFVEQVAAIIAKTYAERGDGATLPDDIALMRIRDLLLELDEGILLRKKKAHVRKHP